MSRGIVDIFCDLLKRCCVVKTNRHLTTANNCGVIVCKGISLYEKNMVSFLSYIYANLPISFIYVPITLSWWRGLVVIYVEA